MVKERVKKGEEMGKRWGRGRRGKEEEEKERNKAEEGEPVGTEPPVT